MPKNLAKKGRKILFNIPTTFIFQKPSFRFIPNLSLKSIPLKVFLQSGRFWGQGRTEFSRSSIQETKKKKIIAWLTPLFFLPKQKLVERKKLTSQISSQFRTPPSISNFDKIGFELLCLLLLLLLVRFHSIFLLLLPFYLVERERNERSESVTQQHRKKTTCFQSLTRSSIAARDFWLGLVLLLEHSALISYLNQCNLRVFLEMQFSSLRGYLSISFLKIMF